jgi:RNA polymerase sigma factor (sigma-70 family)
MTPESYGQAYEEGFVRTVRIMRARGAPLHTAEDLAQAAWLQGWQKLDQLRDEGMIVSWVIAIAINYQRRGSRLEARYQDLPEICGCAGIDLVALDAAKVLNFCPAGYRVLFEQQLGGLTTKEIAKKQGVSATAIRIRLFRARRAVRTRMKDRAAELRECSRSEERVATAA